MGGGTSDASLFVTPRRLLCWKLYNALQMAWVFQLRSTRRYTCEQRSLNGRLSSRPWRPKSREDGFLHLKIVRSTYRAITSGYAAIAPVKRARLAKGGVPFGLIDNLRERAPKSMRACEMRANKENQHAQCQALHRAPP